MKNCSIGVICVILAGISGLASATVIHVPTEYLQIHDAVQAAGYGDTVLVAPGTYYDCTHETEGPGSTPACVIMKSGVTLRGSGPDATIIDAKAWDTFGNGRGIFVELVSDCRIENLQVTGAYADVYGAGILARQVDNTIEITDVKIYRNGDGGVIIINNADPVLTRVDFIDNSAKLGGGLAVENNSDPTVVDCTFTKNSAPTAGGIMVRTSSDPSFSGCLIENNYVNTFGNGGGVAVQNSNVVFTNCQIINNNTEGNGGGISFVGATGSMTDCTVANNETSGSESALGGGIFIDQSPITLTNVLVYGNNAIGKFAYGGGIYVDDQPAPTIENCTVARNHAKGLFAGGGGIYCDDDANPTISKCILAYAVVGAGLGCDTPANPTVSCTDIYGNEGGDAVCGIDGGDNFYALPRFCNTPPTEYYLGENSPCAPGNHPNGPTTCGGELIGALPVGCGFIGVGETPAIQAKLLGNSPNPFNPQTHIFFVLGEEGPATVRIYDVRGQAVKTLSLGRLPAGTHQVLWDGTNDVGRDVSSGVYFYELQAFGERLTQRMALIR
ncbi:MAG: right-handed parallel beta-helix repeat-containing protein [bacterium]